MNQKANFKTVTLKDLWGVFVQRLWAIILAACICCGGLLVFNRMTFVPQYASTATLYILRQADGATASDASSDFSLALKVVNDCTYLLKSHPPNPVELLSGQYFEELLKAAKESYDYVLIDVPPLGSVIDAAVVAAKCDGTILVISDNQVRYRQAIEVIEQLRKSGSKILGVVRNNIKKKDGSYYKKYYKSRYQ